MATPVTMAFSQEVLLSGYCSRWQQYDDTKTLDVARVSRSQTKVHLPIFHFHWSRKVPNQRALTLDFQCLHRLHGQQFFRPRVQRPQSECDPRLPAVLHIQLAPSGLLSNRSVSSFRRRYSAQSRALNTRLRSFLRNAAGIGRHPCLRTMASYSLTTSNHHISQSSSSSSEQQALTFDFEVKTCGHLCTCAT